MQRLCAILVCASISACAETPPPHLIVRAARVIDGTTTTVREHVRIDIDRGTIVSITPDQGETLSSTVGVAIIDAREATVLPGLIDTHTRAPATKRCATYSPWLAVAALRHLAALSRRGITTAVLVDFPLATSIALRRYVGTARHRGPRVLVSGPALFASYPLPDSRPAEGEAILNLADAVSLVRERAEADVDCLAIAFRPPFATVPINTARLCSMVSEAHAQKLPVLALAPSWPELVAARTCGVDHVESPLLQPVPIALTSSVDTCATALANARGPLGRMVAAGMSPLAAINTATSGGAHALGLGEALGQIAVGYRADLLVVAGRPDESIGDIDRVESVVIDGIEQRLEEPSWLASPRVLLSVLWAWLGG